MARPSLSQRQRNKNNPIDLGTFSQTSLRYLTGGLGPKWKPVGYKDTSLNSNGGIGGGIYNAWYKITITDPAWIIVVKGPPRPNYIQVSVYDLDNKIMEGRGIWDGDSLSSDGSYYPYFDTVMGSQSDLYNTYDSSRLDKGNELYYPLEAGSYLLCVSSTRNEDIDYEVGVVVEFPSEPPYFMNCEDNGVHFALEDTVTDANTVTIESPITANINIGPTTKGFTEQEAEIIPSGVTVAIFATGVGDDRSSWLITANSISGLFLLDTTPNWESTFHSHSLSEWQEAWYRDHQSTNTFPAIFVPLTNIL